MKRHLATVTAALTASLAAASALAATPPPGVEHAIGLFMTAQAQEYFHQNLTQVLFMNGYSLDQGAFDSWHYEAQDPLVLDNLPVEYQKFKGSLGTVRDLLKHWLRGFELKDPLFAADVTGIQYQASFKKFGLTADANATMALNQPNSAILVFAMEVPELRITVDSVRARDLNNPFLGAFGIDNISTGLAAGSQPLTISVPLLLNVTPSGGFGVKVLSVTSNFSDIALGLDFKRPMLLPEVELLVNGHPVKLNQKTLEDNLLKHEMDMLQALQKYLGDFAENNVPGIVNALIEKNMPEGFSEVNEMNPPGADNPGQDDKFKWGLTPESLALDHQHLFLGFSSWVQDPKVGNSDSVYYHACSPLPKLADLPVTDYDMALSVNQGFINRMLELSYARKYFEAIPAGGEVLTLVAPPTLKIDGSAGANKGKVHMRVQNVIKGIRSWFVNNPFQFEADMVVRPVHQKDGSNQLVVDQIDEKSVTIEKKYIRTGLMSGAVHSVVLSHLKDANKQFAKTPKVLVQNLPIPSQVGGIPINVTAFQADPNGYLVLYVNLGAIK